MRGSVYYQSSQLVKQIFQEGAKKEDKINPNHEYTMNTIKWFQAIKLWRATEEFGTTFLTI